MTGNGGRRWQLLATLAVVLVAVSTSTFYTYGALFDEESFNATIEGEACQNGSNCPAIGTYDVGYGDVEVGDGNETVDLHELTATPRDPPGGERTVTVPDPAMPSTATATETERGDRDRDTRTRDRKQETRTRDRDRTEDRERPETVTADRRQGNETEERGTEGPPTRTDDG